ncbi:uncharacterized protein LOC141914904 [Tubulanus polymorphus]|uniref:uncharacterized protein LOC141914904 n=1 Tax=Tubulanus polymorphus TaxID=672921 RepID=UPI003DA6673E
MASAALVFGFLMICLVSVNANPIEEKKQSSEEEGCRNLKGEKREEGDSWYEKNLLVQCTCDRFEDFMGGQSGNAETKLTRRCLTFGCRLPETDEIVRGHSTRTTEDGKVKCRCIRGQDPKLMDGYTMWYWKCNSSDVYWTNPPY